MDDTLPFQHAIRNALSLGKQAVEVTELDSLDSFHLVVERNKELIEDLSGVAFDKLGEFIRGTVDIRKIIFSESLSQKSEKISFERSVDDVFKQTGHHL